MAMIPEKRECDDCGYEGQPSDEVAVCLRCGENAPIESDDRCEECGSTGCLGLACPQCGGRMALIDEFPEARQLPSIPSKKDTDQ